MSIVSARAVGAVVAVRLPIVLALFPLFTLAILASFTFVKALNLSDVFSFSLEIILLLLNFILSVLAYKNPNTIITRLVGVLVYKDFNLLEPFFQNLGIVL